MYKAALFLLGLLLVASFAPQQAEASVNLADLLEGRISIEGNADITSDLEAFLRTALDFDIVLDVPEILGGDIVGAPDLDAFDLGTIQWDASVSSTGEVGLVVDLPSLTVGVEATQGEDQYSGSITIEVGFALTISAGLEEGSLAFTLEEVGTTLKNVSVNINDIPDDSLLDMANEAVFTLVEEGLNAVNEQIQDFGETVFAAVNDEIRGVVAPIPRVTLTFTGIGTVEEVADGIVEVVGLVLGALEEFEIGEFEGGVVVGGVLAGSNENEVQVVFWILDNEDGKSGADAVAELFAAFEADPEAFGPAGITGFQVTEGEQVDGSESSSENSAEDGSSTDSSSADGSDSTDGDGSSASRLVSLLF